MAMTPVMRQYEEIKSRYPDMILLFHMGDFYEMFHEDAKTAARVLNLTLTSRSKGEGAIPMAGVPCHAVHGYIKRLIDAGYKVAVCDQIQDPREAKGIVDRDVTRVITPGTLTEDALLDSRDHNYLAAVLAAGEQVGLAWIDLSTGEFRVEDAPVGKLVDEISRINPSEILLPESLRDEHEEDLAVLHRETGAMITFRPDWAFGRDTTRKLLLDHFHVKTLDGFGCGDLGPALCSAGAALQYLQETQKMSLGHIRALSRSDARDRVVLDRHTQISLELTRTMREATKQGTLLWLLDKTLTSMGARMLKEWLIGPLRSQDDIIARQDGVEEFHRDRAVRAATRGELNEVYDIERLTARVATGRANARDLIALRRSLVPLPALKDRLVAADTIRLRAIAADLDPVEDVRALIDVAIAPDPPVQIKEGGLIRGGYSAELDELRSLQREGKSWIARFQARESERTGIPSLKIGYNKVFGYYIEVTHVHGEKVPAEYVRKQTLKNAERYITPELKEYETKVLRAEDRARELEYDLFMKVRSEVDRYAARLQKTARVLAEIDVLAALAEVAAAHRYVRPTVTEGHELKIVNGRHPVLEKTVSEPFVPNDTDLDGESAQMMIITGPNMAGKSTYIRQVALIALMAHMGSFVPADSARIGLIDRIFTRVGASDELSRGQSTFMVEMIETANIVNNATDRSLIILDEVGRGTSTFDGVSIAWAVAEYIVQRIKCRTLFATHYHELTELASIFGPIRNYNIAVREWQDEIIFLRGIVEGGTDKSYGIHVARLAGVPPAVVERAKVILDNLETAALDGGDKPRLARTQKARRPGQKTEIQLALFGEVSDVLADAVRRLELTAITPLDAMNKLQELKDMIAEPPRGKKRRKKK